jgi:hypothetical protein
MTKENIKIQITWVELMMLKGYVEGVVNIASGTKDFNDKLIVACLFSLMKKLATKTIMFHTSQGLSLTRVEALALHQGYTTILNLDDIHLQSIVAKINQVYS